MENILKLISNEVETHCQNIDNFNKEMIGNIEKTSNDTLTSLLSLLSLEEKPKNKQKRAQTVYNPFNE
jgi:hypothetical protein